MNRRNALKRITGLAAAIGAKSSVGAAGLAANAAATPGSLREAAAAHGMVYGAAIPWEELSANKAFAAIVGAQCGILVPEIELKWKALRPTPETFDFTRADLLHSFATSHGMLFRGHTLVWEQALPKWFAGTVNAQNAEALMTQHISTVVGHYAGRMHSWDVVNEPLQLEDGRADGLKVTAWLRFLGPEYIDQAFHAAHAADPTALLVLNENWLEPSDSGTESRRRAMLTLLSQMKKRGVPVHALGVQSHLLADADATGWRFERFLHAVEDLGLKILVTEMDVRDQGLPGNTQERDRLVAQQYQNYVSFMRKFSALETIITWGLTDRFTWLATSHPRRDGLPVRPLLYDAALNPKASWEAVRSALEKAPPRTHTA